MIAVIPNFLSNLFTFPGLLLAIGAGITAILAFPLVISPWSVTPLFNGTVRLLAILSCSAIMYTLTRCQRWTLKQQIFHCFIAGGIFFLGLLYWLVIAMVEYGNLPYWQALIILALLASYCSLYWAALPILLWPVKQYRYIQGPIGFAFAVVILEWARSICLTGFPWGLWGYALAQNIWIAQWASIAGITGLSWLIAYVGAWLGCYFFIKNYRPNKLTLVWQCLLVIIITGWGAWRYHNTSIQSTTHQHSYRIAFIQGNIDQKLKNSSTRYRNRIMKRYVELSKNALEPFKPDLIVWPESAWPLRIPTNTTHIPHLNLDVPVLIGASSIESENKKSVLYNSAFWVDDQARPTARYDKQHLVPFGEYVPWRNVLPVNKFVPGLLDYSPGHSNLPIGSPASGVLICYDGIFSHIARSEVLAGAELLINMTNDGWYGISSGPYQHLEFYIFRAIENARWVVRAANTGISAFVNPAGDILQATTLQSTDMRFARIQAKRDTTIYTYFGDWVIVLAFALSLGIFGKIIYKKVRPKNA